MLPAIDVIADIETRIVVVPLPRPIAWSNVRVSEREVSAVALDTGELACRHQRSFAKHRTITALEHARALKTQRAERRGAREPVVEVRSLAAYDALIA